ncbi:MAG TPA: 16S rRNA (cytosine(1402)-N(4))-methyltransferase RsmH [Caulobacteraceae bacterium]|jgi:16S rRNA (cytosine1402-N4)-methyltransferase|nr:16S rRNA (cytosine(1402)-N(4))-methyltransferase RsmH [Caulobacteraceae bacterium]
MAGPAPHTPVLLAEVLAAIAPAPGRTIVDGTFGAGGYSRAFLAAGARVVAFDRDPSAVRFAAALGEDLRLVTAPFSAMADELGEASVDGVALDLGLSSMQLDEAERGFSLMRDGPLDMRMASAGPTAADLVNGESVEALARIFRDFGEQREARRIARAIEARRQVCAFARTLDLAEVVERALGGRRGAKIHPATRVFQALRIAVNEELVELELGLLAAERTLKAGGRLAVVTFHSLEDRMVKAFLNPRAGRMGEASRHAPPRQPSAPPSFTLLHAGARAPGDAEIGANPRARSAKLRAAVRTDAPVWKSAA